MGKRKDKDRDHGSPGKKKQKKHKKHKKKRERAVVSDEEIDVVNDDSLRDEGKALKVKIKFGGQTLSTTEVEYSDSAKEDIEADDILNSSVITDVETEGNAGRRNKRKLDDDEWLDALEKGELDDTGDIKKEKDASLMTARQRALRGEKVHGEELLQLPMYTEKTEEETEAFERKRKLRAKKRRQQMQKQIEDTKTQTIEKLLKGQKGKKDAAKQQNKKIGDHVRYTSNKDGFLLSYTGASHYPLVQKQISSVPPDVIKCSVRGCENRKKYSCSATKLPVCSLDCYKVINNQQVISV